MGTDEVDDFLAHHGIKGMKWGKRKGSSSDADSSEKPAKKLSRKEVRAVNREGQARHDRVRIETVYQEALAKGDKVLVSTMLRGDYAKTVMTGKQFVESASVGTEFNARVTDVFAERQGRGQYELRDNSDANYKPVSR